MRNNFYHRIKSYQMYKDQNSISAAPPTTTKQLALALALATERGKKWIQTHRNYENEWMERMNDMVTSSKYHLLGCHLANMRIRYTWSVNDEDDDDNDEYKYIRMLSASKLIQTDSGFREC